MPLQKPLQKKRFHTAPLFSQEPTKVGHLLADVKRWESSFIPKLGLFETSEHDFFYGTHMHKELEILWARSGAGKMVFRDQQYIMKPGDAVIIAPGELHAGGTAEGYFSMAMLHIPLTLLTTLLNTEGYDENTIPGLPPVQFISGSFSESLYQQVLTTLPHTQTENEQVACIEDLLYKLLSSKQFMRKKKLPASRNIHPSITQAIKLLGENFTEAIDYYQLAKEVDLNRHYFIALFKSATGVTPYQYQLSLRIDLCRQLLLQNRPLSSIATISGFADQSHFHRHFKRIYCATPGSFREHIHQF